MKKTLLIVAMLLLVTPVMATTTVKVLVNPADQFTASDGNKVQPVSIAYVSDVNVRAFALDINIYNNAGSPNFQNIRNFKTGESNAASPGYGIFPSRFRDFIVVTGPNWVDTNYNPTTAWNEPGTTDHNSGMGFPKMIVEMGALFVGDANKPPLSGTLFKFDVNAWGQTGTFHITVAADALRGGVVNKDGNTITAAYEGNDVCFAPPVCTVPNVVNQTEATATANIVNAGFTLGTRTTTCSATIASGSVISTNPAAGVQPCGTAVAYVVSTGTCLCTVPNVVSQAEATATVNIVNAGFTLGTRTTTCSNTIAAGSVISTSPAYTGTPITCGTAVAYVVSTGSCDCFPSSDPNYGQWCSVLKPTSWCNSNLRQCHGDADNAQEKIGKSNYWVGYNDLTVFLAGFQKTYTNPTACPWIAADFDHQQEKIGKTNYRVGYNDLNIFLANFQKTTVPNNCPHN
jgi:hypothetical protein